MASTPFVSPGDSVMGDDLLARLFSQAAAVGNGSSDDWDDDLVSQTIDEIVAGMLPPPTQNPNSHHPFRFQHQPRDASTEDDDDDDDDDDEEEEEEPSFAASSAPSSASSADAVAAKRLRHREAMQRCRERKRSRMGALEKQQRQLKSVLRQRLVDHRQREQRAAARASGRAPPLAVDTTTVDELRKLFADVVRLKEELLDERHALQDLLRAHQKFEKIVTSATSQIVNEPTAPPALGGPEPMDVEAADSLDDDASSSGQDSSTAGGGADPTGARRRKGPAGHWVQYLDHEDPLFYEPEPEDSVVEHTRETFLRVRRLQDIFNNRLGGFAIQETFCLGWAAQHAVTRTPDHRLELRFRFRRRVPLARMALAEIQGATWNVMKDPVQNARLYSSLVVCKIVQWVGENTFIFIRNAPDKDKRLHIRYFSMHSQMEYRTDRGERAMVTLMKVLDKDPHLIESEAKPKTPVVWLKEGTLFLGFTEKLESSEIEIEYGGSIHCMSDQHAQYLLIEVGGALMRWEHMVIPQRLLPL